MAFSDLEIFEEFAEQVAPREAVRKDPGDSIRSRVGTWVCVRPRVGRKERDLVKERARKARSKRKYRARKMAANCPIYKAKEAARGARGRANRGPEYMRDYMRRWRANKKAQRVDSGA